MVVVGGGAPGFEFVEQREGGAVVGGPRYAAGSGITNKCVTAALGLAFALSPSRHS